METNQTKQAFNWQQAIEETYQDFSRQIIDYAPQLIGALALLLIGWLVAHLLRLATKRIVQGFDSIFKKAAKNDGPRKEKIKNSYALILGQIVFWAVILFFVTASANLLGWQMFTGWMEGIVGFLPSLITGLLIILAGFLISNTARAAILGTHGSHAPILSRIAQIVILFSAVVIGIDLIGLNMNFLNTVVVVIIGILLAGAALGFGLGANSLVANIIGTQYTRNHCKVGEHLKLEGVEGEILEITQTSIVLDTAEGRAVIPGKLFNERISLLRSGQTPSGPEPEKKEKIHE